jgi:hypothetical protein
MFMLLTVGLTMVSHRARRIAWQGVWFRLDFFVSRRLCRFKALTAVGWWLVVINYLE